MQPIVYLILNNFVRALVFLVCLVISEGTHASKYLYPQISPQVSADISVTQFTHCVDHVALIAHSVHDYHYLMGLYEDFVFDSRMRFLPVCLLPPMMLTEDITAEQIAASQGSLTIRASQIVKVQAQGNAFVSDAVMQLAHADTYAVFIHELAHFAGFLDEYPMSAAAARFQCNIARQAPNVIHASQLNDSNGLPHPYAELFAAQLTLRPSKRSHEHIGCAVLTNNDKNAKRTQRYLLHPNVFNFLRFYDVQYIPYLYQYLWQQQVLQGRTSQLMSSAAS